MTHLTWFYPGFPGLKNNNLQSKYYFTKENYFTISVILSCKSDPSPVTFPEVSSLF